MRKTALFAILCLLAACGQRNHQANAEAELANEQAEAKQEGEQQAKAVIAATREDALEARVANLEREVDQLKAVATSPVIEQAAPVVPPAAPPPPPPPPAPPKLSYRIDR